MLCEQSHIDTFSSGSQIMLCLLPESHWHIIKMSHVNALSLGRVTLAYYQDGTGQCSVSCQSHIGTLLRCHRSMLCLLAESHWHIIKMSQVNALSLARVTLSHYQDDTGQCSVSCQSRIGTLSRCHPSMLCHLAESRWHIINLSPVNALSLGRVTLAHYQDGTGQCSVSCQSPCLLYTSPSPRDRQKSRMPSSA